MTEFRINSINILLNKCMTPSRSPGDKHSIHIKWALSDTNIHFGSAYHFHWGHQQYQCLEMFFSSSFSCKVSFEWLHYCVRNARSTELVFINMLYINLNCNRSFIRSFARSFMSNRWSHNHIHTLTHVLSITILLKHRLNYFNMSLILYKNFGD